MSFNTYAHDSKEAYFKIIKTESNIVVQAEFPWTIRNALFYFKPELENTKNKTVFENAFFDYVATSFIITNSNNRILKLLKVEMEAIPEGHNHQTNYIFTFENGELFEIKIL